MNIVEVKDRTNVLVEQLLKVWESSVRATHLFLSNEEIENIKKYVPQALKEISYLILFNDEKQQTHWIHGDQSSNVRNAIYCS